MSLAATSERSLAPVTTGLSLSSGAMLTSQLQKSSLFIFSCSSQAVHFSAAPLPQSMPQLVALLMLVTQLDSLSTT